MLIGDESVCPNCSGKLKRYDSVSRLVRRKGGKADHITIHRMKCTKCNKVHRKIPNDICPYKQYEFEIINGVIEGFITSDTYGFEDYPCETTMKRWTARNIQDLL